MFWKSWHGIQGIEQSLLHTWSGNDLVRYAGYAECTANAQQELEAVGSSEQQEVKSNSSSSSSKQRAAAAAAAAIDAHLFKKN